MSAAAINAISKYTQRCADCGSSDFVEDMSAGDLICRACGVVAESHTIDERSEWRTFGDSDKQSGPDPTRVGAANNSLLDDLGIGNTAIVASGKDGGNALARALQKTQQRTSSDASLHKAVAEMNRVADRMALTKAVRDTAIDYYKMVQELRGVRGRSVQAVVAAALFCACRQEQQARTFKEIEAAVPSASKKDIAKAYTALVKKLQAEDKMKAVKASAVSDYINRYASRLGMAQPDVKACRAVADIACPREGLKEDKPWSSRTQQTQCAAIMWLVTRLPHAQVRPSADAIAAECQITAPTLLSAYREFHQEAASIVPDWVATPQEIASSLPAPTA